MLLSNFVVLVALAQVVAVLGNPVTVDMTCFPPPMDFNQMGPVPWPTIDMVPINACPSGCVEPVNHPMFPFPSEFSSIVKDGSGNIVGHPFGEARLQFYQNNPLRRASARVTITGVAPGQVLTMWNSHFFPLVGPTGAPIFDAPGQPAGFAGGNAAVEAPAIPLTHGVTNGRDPTQEGNYLFETSPGTYVFDGNFDYDFTQGNEAPVRNGRSFVDQTTINGTITPEAVQTPGFMAGIGPTGSSYLFEFDNVTGFRKTDADGLPVIVRSPNPISFFAVVLHTDKQTHGLSPGLPTPPLPGTPWTVGDHFLIGMFDLRFLWDSPPSPPTITAPPFCAA